MVTLAFIQRKRKRHRRTRRRRRQRQRSRNTTEFPTHPRRNSTRDKEAQPSFPNIPEEIILQILQRLPLKSLSRFACVSKKWLSLISNISVTKRGRDMVLVNSDCDSLLHSIDLEKSQGERVYESGKSTRWSDHIRRAICGSCNGLVVVIIDPDFFLWNPLTGYCKKVLSYGKLEHHMVSGLCYDSSTDDYKIVTVIVEHSYTPGYGYETVVVGSLRSKSWTHVDCSSYIIGSFNPGPVVNERLHWHVSEESDDGDVSEESTDGYGYETVKYSRIVYFDPQMGTFKKVPMPKPKQSDDGDVIYGLGVLDGCLCMSRSENPSDGESNYIEVLAMKEYGMGNSWTPMFLISNLRPFGYTKNGEALALALKEPPNQERKGIWHISVYDPMDNSTRDIPIPTPLPTASYEVYALTYEESLVKPTDYNWEDEELRGEATYVEYFLNGTHQKMKMERETYWREERFEQPKNSQCLNSEDRGGEGWEAGDGYGW